MSESWRNIIFLVVFFGLISLSLWALYPMRGWSWYHWLAFILLIPGVSTLAGIVFSSELDYLLCERRLNKILRKAQKETKALILEIRAKKK